MNSDWLQQAACRGMDTNLFFPERGDRTDEAKAACAGCPVTAECLDYALSLDRYLPGVWGGASERQRRRMKPPLRPTQCPRCRTVFTPYRRGLKYCTPECRELAHSEQRYASNRRLNTKSPYPRTPDYADFYKSEREARRSA